MSKNYTTVVSRGDEWDGSSGANCQVCYPEKRPFDQQVIPPSRSRTESPTFRIRLQDGSSDGQRQGEQTIPLATDCQHKRAGVALAGS